MGIKSGLTYWSKILRHSTSADSKQNCEKMKVLGSKLGAVASPEILAFLALIAQTQWYHAYSMGKKQGAKSEMAYPIGLKFSGIVQPLTLNGNAKK